MKAASFAAILRLFAENDVEVVVVGMLAGVLQGAPLTTADIDVVHRRTPDNIARLLSVLRSIHAVPRRSATSRAHGVALDGTGHQLLETDLGDLDCLGTIDNGRGYEELVVSAVSFEVLPSKFLKVIDLASLI